MGDQAPLTLVQLARQRLLKEEALVISSLEDLPINLIPGIFEEAFTDRRTNILRAMVAAWPFPCLPAGVLIKKPCLETLKALLDGLDVLITEKLHPSNSTCLTNRRLKLKVLDLTQVCHDFWSVGTRSHEGDFSSQAMRQKQPVEVCPKSEVEKPFMVLTDLELKKAMFKECDKCLLDWAQKQKHSAHLCCRRLSICDSSVFIAMEVFKIIHPDCILFLQLRHWWLEFIVQFFPYLGQMRNLHTFVLQGIQKPSRFDASSEQEWISMLRSELSKLSSLKNLHLMAIYFLTGCLEEWLRCVTMPLETLSITDCPLSQSDLDYLMQRLNICELRHLKLGSIDISDLCPKLLEGLLEKITTTLQTLVLEDCEMKDSHFKAILPALSQCSQLTKINFYYNDISLLTLKNLLHHTARLRKLTQEMYPAPLECYEESRIRRDKFQELCPQLLDILRAQRQPKEVSFATRICLNCFDFCFYDTEARLCRCGYIG